MIAKAPAKGKYGSDTYGLLRYLFGPGKSNEHRDQHLVAAWDPEWLAGGAFANRYRGWLPRLAREIDAPMTGHDVELPGGHVYHVVLSVPRQDGVLGDARWRELVEEAIERMGFGPDGDGRGGCGWVAVHHGPSKDGNDHVHLAINLVRGDGLIADTYRDWPRWRQWCLEIEQRLGLTRTSPANKTAPIRATRAEVEKAARGRRPGTSRDLLRRAVRAAATEASSAAEFIALLEHEPLVSVQPRWNSEGQLTGYRAALFADWSTMSPDNRVWFGGGRLAHDLSAPRLTARWASIRKPTQDPVDTRQEPNDLLTRAKQAIDNARHHLAAHVNTRYVSAGSIGDIAHATMDMLIAVARALGGPTSGALANASVTYESAVLAPRQGQPVWWAEVVTGLRTAARDLLRAGVLSKHHSTGLLAVALLLALAALLAQIAAWRQHSHQQVQATAALSAATMVEQYGKELYSRHPPPVRPRPNTPRLSPIRKRTELQSPARRSNVPQQDPATRGMR